MLIVILIIALLVVCLVTCVCKRDMQQVPYSGTQLFTKKVRFSNNASYAYFFFDSHKVYHCV